MQKRVVIIGGGAAGYFAAINITAQNPEMDVIILEKSQHVLQKVKISGGGDAILTNLQS